MPRKPVKRNKVSNPEKKQTRVSTIVDGLSLKIMKEMLNDADVKSAIIAQKYNSPLSTIQRRRTHLERTILKKRYHIDINALGWRKADLIITVEQGDSEETAKKLLDDNRNNITEATLRIGDPEINLMAQAFYRSTEELHRLIEGTKSLPKVNSVEWSEVVRTIENDKERLIERLFDSNQTGTQN